jgi:hypothetical protein
MRRKIEPLRSGLLHDESTDSWLEWIALADPSFAPQRRPTFSNSAVALQGAVSGQRMALGSRILAKDLLESRAFSEIVLDTR